MILLYGKNDFAEVSKNSDRYQICESKEGESRNTNTDLLKRYLFLEN